jgi:beta-xylosidase
MRTVVIHRSDNIHGPYEGRLALQDLGVAQGGLIDTPDGKWFAYLFRDYGAVGRIPYLVPVTWVDGWPVLAGKVPEELDLTPNKSLIPGVVASDEFNRKRKDVALPLVWQWNHNPDNRFWSITKRPGFLRLTTGRTDSTFLNARNTLTQRTIGPQCSGSTMLDVSKMKEGDVAGLAVLQKEYGLIGVTYQSGVKSIVMKSAATKEPVTLVNMPANQTQVHLKIQCDFLDLKDTASFYYSADGVSWTKADQSIKMRYTLPHFMGYRFGLFNYATRNTGGFVDFDFFRISDQ